MDSAFITLVFGLEGFDVAVSPVPDAASRGNLETGGGVVGLRCCFVTGADAVLVVVVVVEIAAELPATGNFAFPLAGGAATSSSW